jgi:oligopeptide transport system ATP-binding protein
MDEEKEISLPKLDIEKWEEEKKAKEDRIALLKQQLDENNAAIAEKKASFDEAMNSATTPEQKKNLQEAYKKDIAPFAKNIADIKYALRYAKVTYKPELTANKTILAVRHLRQFFDLGGGEKTKAVHNVSFDIHEGECFGLVGESGCGKTTTGRSIIRLYDITSGSIYYKGYRISGGTRWNEKEIKWSRQHVKTAIKKLEDRQAVEIAAIPLKSQDIEQEILDLQNQEKEELAGPMDPLNDDQEALTAAIKQKYETQFAEKEALLKMASLKEEEQKREIEHYYGAQIAGLRETERLWVHHQKEKIRQIRYDNSHVDRKLVNEIQMIFQDPVDSLDPRMTVEDIIQEGLHIQHHYNKVENHEKCLEMLEKVGLIPEYASRYPHEFSGGQRQRIGIARALIMNPRMLICDEPISALDVSIRAQILNLLNDIKEEMGITIMFIAHDLSVVKYFCDRIAVMYYGNMVELANSDELFKHPLHPYTRALLSAIPKPDPLSEKNRIRRVYNPAKEHDYSRDKPSFREVIPGHFVLCNNEELQKYRSEIAELDKEKLNPSDIAK